MKSIKFGIIGCGTIAHFHAKAIAAAEGAVLFGVADINPTGAERFADTYGVRAYETAEKLLSDSEIDAVCICTPSGFHADGAIKAINAGKHVMIEKPLAVTDADCDRIIRAAKEKGVTAGVITQYRFSPAIQRLKELVDSGKLGKIISAELVMKYNRTQEYYDSSAWRGTWCLDGGSLMNQGIHGVDALLYVMGEVKSVCGYMGTLTHNMEAEDTACAAVAFQSGAFGLVQSTTCIYRGYPRNLVVSGTKGTVSVKDDRIDFIDAEGTEHAEPPPAFVGTGYANAADIDVAGHIFQISDFVEAIREKREPVITLREAKKDVAFINAVYESAQTGKKIDLF
jgi:predicted dehydrogenase